MIKGDMVRIRHGSNKYMEGEVRQVTPHGAHIRFPDFTVNNWFPYEDLQVVEEVSRVFSTNAAVSREAIDKVLGWEKGGTKLDDGKLPMHLLDAEALEELAKVLQFGAKKYAAENWRKGINLSRLFAALLRHTLAALRGVDNDEETGLPHAAHAMCCCMFIIWTMKHRPDLDDRYKGAE